MNNATPHKPDSSIEALDHGTREKSPNSIDPTSREIGLAFPKGAIESLRTDQGQCDEDGVCVIVSRQAVEETLAWIDRYVPRPVQCAEDAVVVDGIYELRIDYPDEHPRRNVDLIRVNGRVFVPETPVEAIDVDRIVEEITRDVAELGDRTSPDDWPEAMIVTGDELAMIVRRALGADEEAVIGSAIGEAIRDGAIAGTRALILDDEPTVDGRFPGDPRVKEA